MSRLLVLYYSQTGNTQKMAEAVAERARSVQGTKVELKYHLTPEELADYDAIVAGDPTYHHDMTSSMKKLFEEASVKNVSLEGKTGAAFGSYGWSGEAPKLLLEIMKEKFHMSIFKPPLLIKYTPDQAGLEECRQLGRKIAEKLMR